MSACRRCTRSPSAAQNSVAANANARIVMIRLHHSQRRAINQTIVQSIPRCRRYLRLMDRRARVWCHACEGAIMKHQHVSTAIVLAASMVAVTMALAAQSQDRFTLKSSNGIAFAEFKGYDAWQLIATSQHDGDDGCGTSKDGCMKAIVGNPIMIKAYQRRLPGQRQAGSRRRGDGEDRMAEGHRRGGAVSDHRAGRANRSGVHGEGLEAVQGHERMGIRHARSTTPRRTPTSRTPARASPSFAQGRATRATPSARRRPTSSTPASRDGDAP